MDTLSSSWIAWLVLFPLLGAVAAFLIPRMASLISLAVALAVCASTSMLIWALAQDGLLLTVVGGWPTPLGITLRADGFSSAMLATAALVGLAITVYARGYFDRHAAQARGFWPLWLFLWTALNALFLSGDLFNLYVTLELLGLSAVSLVALAGGRDALAGALRYLLVSLVASLAYLCGVVLVYSAHGTVDILLLRGLMRPDLTTWTAMGLFTAGLMFKSALFPLHFWLPPAHGAAPAPVSALLSGLVVKASFFVLARLWLELFPVEGAALGQFVGLLGSLAIAWGSVQALRQPRLKMVVAYSTVAQLGYLFLVFPMATTKAATVAWQGIGIFISAHALAKAAMFLAAGNILRYSGHDRIAELSRAPHGIGLSWAALFLSSVTIMGLPPSGAFSAKWLLLKATLQVGQWWWIVPILGGSILAAAYTIRMVAHAFSTEQADPSGRPGLPGTMEWSALLLALASILMGFISIEYIALLSTGGVFDDRSAQ